MSDQKVFYDEPGSRYVISVDDQEAGFAAFVEEGDVRNFNHTVVHSEFQGQGLTKPLLSTALKETVAEDKKIRATCSAVQHFLSKDENASLREYTV